MEIFAAVAVGLVLTFLSILSQVALWQRKEYRHDRMWVYVRSREWYVRYVWLLLVLAAALDVGWMGYLTHRILLTQVAGWIALLALAAYHGWRILERGIYRPKPTVKSGLIIIGSAILMLVYVWLVMNSLEAVALQWATLLTVMPVIVGVTVLLINLGTDWRKLGIITEAKQLRAALPDLVVVGITGSYGKTSTKYFLDQILIHANFPHVTTDQHRNETLVVAQDMLHKLSTKSLIYLVEMGAYRLGEIASLVELTQPRIGVVTAIGNQHVALFGSHKNLVKAKWELIRGLPANGVAILNTDDPIIKKKGEKIVQKTLWYSAKRVADVYAKDINIEARSITATIHIGTVSRVITIPLIGVVLDSVLAAAAAALALGVAPTGIISALENLLPVARTMELCQGIRKTTIIDDSYSGNETGVIAAINHLDRFNEAQKIIITTPLIELGFEAADAHYRIGQILAKSGAEVFICGIANRKDLMRGAGKYADEHFHFIVQPNKLLTEVKSTIESGAVILLEGRIPDVVRQGLRK